MVNGPMDETVVLHAGCAAVYIQRFAEAGIFASRIAHMFYYSWLHGLPKSVCPGSCTAKGCTRCLPIEVSGPTEDPTILELSVILLVVLWEGESSRRCGLVRADSVAEWSGSCFDQRLFGIEECKPLRQPGAASGR
ncbi:MAG: hypothetical protein KAW89_00750 [Armatimonadetes bacterium]|nr:hypothetical protein [Armatimonadota bacterium]